MQRERSSISPCREAITEIDGGRLHSGDDRPEELLDDSLTAWNGSK